ncbi:helix-turn-helix domain-containing protein [Streptomyces coeruleoprunus]|uniref:Helix-turn-helix domain-containing protein n=1 Tax=Streptomyces coeruleoprunus TaxID=285563 RepID=A0ABV9XAS2_9ACTN
MAESERPGEAPAQRLGSALRALQQRSGRTLRSLEREVLISDSSLSRYFRGSTVPPWATVRDLCRALDADPAEYRALWEAADRSQPKQAAEPSGTAAPPDTGVARRRGDAARTWLRSRRVCALGGALSGVLLGAVVTAVALAPGTARTPRSGPGSAPAAGAEGTPGGVWPQETVVRIFVNRATGLCLDDSLDKKLRTYACNGMSYQRWSAHRLPDGSRWLRNHATGACLEDGDAGLRTRPCTSGANGSQTWTVTLWGDESAQVRSRETGRCLADDGPGLRTLPCDRTQRQKWG